MGLSITREEMIESLLRNYQGYFDVRQCTEEEAPLVAECAFHVSSSKYVLIKKAKLWEANCHEYLYLFSVPVLTEDVYRWCESYVYENGMKLIKPDRNHMYTYLSAVIVAESADKTAVKLLKRCHKHKDFQFSLKGWMDFHTAMVQLDSESVYTNYSGREKAKFLKSVLRRIKERKKASSEKES